jgi:hypothetical protein
VAVSRATLATQADLDSELMDLHAALWRYAQDPEARRRLGGLMRCVVDKARATPLGTSPFSARGAVAAALGRCAAELGFSLPARGVDAYLRRPGSSGSVPSVTCSAGGVDPRRGYETTRPATAAEKAEFGLDSTQRMYTDEEIRRRVAAYQEAKAAAEATPAYKAAHDAWLKVEATPGESDDFDAVLAEHARLGEAYQETPEYKALQTAERRLVPFTPPLVSRVSPDAPDVCEAAAALAAQIGACARAAWSGGDCRMLQARLAGCKDPEVIDPLPDQPLCGLRDPDGGEATREEFEAAALRWCTAYADYGPDGGDACRVRPPAGEPPDRLSLAWSYGCWQQGLCTAVSLACSSPLAQPGQDQETCAGHATLEALAPDVSVVLAEGFERLGGPVWTPPGGGGPPGPRPG